MPPNKYNNSRPTSRQAKAGAVFNVEGIKRDVIVIGASAGGVMALSELFAALPAELPASIGVVLHRSTRPSELVEVLGRRSACPVLEPKGAGPLDRGIIYLAPPDHHLLFEPHGVAIHRGPKEHSTRPAVDPLFRSAAASYGNRVAGILLTGSGEDGVSGLIAIAHVSGVTLVQDPDDAYMPYMPMNAMRFDDVAGVFPLRQLPSVIGALAKGESVSARKRQVHGR
jgi:two-component system chemotaxis response regulator CheB